MGRKKRVINRSGIPQYAIERFARCVLDDIRADYADENIQKDFARWQAQRKKAAAKEKQRSDSVDHIVD